MPLVRSSKQSPGASPPGVERPRGKDRYSGGGDRDVAASARRDDCSLGGGDGRALLEMAGVGVAEADPVTVQLLRVIPKMCEIMGYAPDALLGTTFGEIAHPEDREGYTACPELAGSAREALDSQGRRHARRDRGKGGRGRPQAVLERALGPKVRPRRVGDRRVHGSARRGHLRQRQVLGRSCLPSLVCFGGNCSSANRAEIAQRCSST